MSPRWSDIRERLPTDINADELALIRRAGAPARHADRVRATICAALMEAARADRDPAAEALAHEFPGDPAPVGESLEVFRPTIKAVAGMILRLDLAGIGGHGGTGASGASARHPAFRDLGKGRWHASDGACYRAAAVAALEWLDASVGELVTVLEGEADGQLDVVTYEDGAALACERECSSVGVPASWWPWCEAEALRQLASLGALTAEGLRQATSYTDAVQRALWLLRAARSRRPVVAVEATAPDPSADP